MKTFKEFLKELSDSKQVDKKFDDPCWDGYKQLGTKIKDGKTVPNCVKKENLK